MNSNSSSNRSAAVSIKLIVGLAACLLLPVSLFAAAPTWWAAREVVNTTGTANDFAAVNQGQVKNIAVAGVAELNANLPGGAGTVLNQLAVSLSGTTPNTKDYAVVNLGQLKSVVSPFYDQLLSAGYLRYPLESGTYPWISSSTNIIAPANDYAIANIGQVKNLFSFDISTIFITGGDGQSSAPQTWLTAPLSVQVLDLAGNPIVSATVSFTTPSADGGFDIIYGGIAYSTMTAITDASGNAQAFFQLPSSGANTTMSVPVSVTIGTKTSTVKFSVTITDPTTQPASPTIISVVTNSDGSNTITWNDNSNNETGFTIYRSTDGAIWTPVGTVSANITSYTDTSAVSGVAYAYEVASTNTGFNGGTSGNTSPPNITPSIYAVPLEQGVMTVLAAPESSYAIIDLGKTDDVGYPQGVNDSGVVLLVNGSNGYTWQNGSLTNIQTSGTVTEFIGPLQNGTVYWLQSNSNGQLYQSTSIYFSGAEGLSGSNMTDSSFPMPSDLDSTYLTQYNSAYSPAYQAVVGLEGTNIQIYPPETDLYLNRISVNDNSVCAFSAAETGWQSIASADMGPIYWGAYYYGAIPISSSPTSPTKYGLTYYYLYTVSSSGTVVASGSSTSSGQNLAPIDVNVGGDMLAVSGTNYYIVNSGGGQTALPTNDSSVSVGGLTASTVGNGEGPYFVEGNGSGNSKLCCKGAPSLAVDIGGVASANAAFTAVDSQMSGRSISNHLVIPMGDSIWRNSKVHSLADLCGNPTNWSYFNADYITPINDIMAGYAYNNSDGAMHAILFVPVQFSVKNTNNAYWDPATNTLYSGNLQATATIPNIAGVTSQIKCGIARDISFDFRESCPNGASNESTDMNQGNGYLSDYQTMSPALAAAQPALCDINGQATNGTFCTSRPHVTVALLSNNYIWTDTDQPFFKPFPINGVNPNSAYLKASARYYLFVQFGNTTPTIASQVNTTFTLSASGSSLATFTKQIDTATPVPSQTINGSTLVNTPVVGLLTPALGVSGSVASLYWLDHHWK